MNDAPDLAGAKVEEVVKGFFWLLPNIGIGLAVLAGFALAAMLAGRVVSAALTRRGWEDLGDLLSGFARWGIVILGGLVFCTIVFPSVRPADLLGALGVGSVAIGFAFRDILQNWFSGLLILYARPFRTGDMIVSGAYEGVVERVEARATLIRTTAGERVLIPNAEIYTHALTVRTHFASRRSQLDIAVAGDADLDRACRVITETLEGVEGVRSEPAPAALPWTVGAASTGIRVRWWTDSHGREVSGTHGRVVRALRAALAGAEVRVA